MKSPSETVCPNNEELVEGEHKINLLDKKNGTPELRIEEIFQVSRSGPKEEFKDENWL